MAAIDDVLGGRYRLVRLLGRGGMSDVYQALDEVTEGDVAVKIVRSGDPEFVRRLSQEVKALKSFQHPGLIQLLDTGSDGDQTYLVMEYVDGVTLAQLLKSGPLGTTATAALGVSLAQTLSYVHERGIVHRDVKPSNILRAANGDVWLGDFGIAQHHDATTLTAMGSAMGTVLYMAPEQLEGHEVGPSADIWSLGLMLLECLTGKRAFEGTPSEIVARRLTGPVSLPTDLPPPWTLLLSGMLDPRPARRLDGNHVAVLLATSPFAVPWEPLASDATERVSTAVASDVTQRMPGVAGAVTLAGAAALAGDATAVVAAPRASLPVGDSPPWWRSPSGLVALTALVVGLFFWLLFPSPASSPTTTTSTTPTTILSSSHALAALLSTLATAQAAGAIDSGSAQLVTQQAEQALTDSLAGNAAQSQSALQQAANVIVNGVQGGIIAPSAATTLQHNLAVLSKSLGLSPPSTTTTTTTSTPPPGPGNGAGHGRGDGNGNSN